MMNLIFASLMAFAAAPRTEVQVNICEGSATVAQKLTLGNWDQQQTEESVLIDNKDLQLYGKNWVFKVRIDRIEDTVEVILKYNQAGSTNIETDSKKCEHDLHGTSKKWACKMVHELSLEDFDRLQNSKDFAGMLSAEQKTWLHSENLILPSNLEITTPFTDQSYSLKADQKIDLGIGTSVDGIEFLEASTRAKSDEAIAAQIDLLNYLKSKHVVLCADQGPLLTRLKLESFFNRQ
jgi:hypothetical protein